MNEVVRAIHGRDFERLRGITLEEGGYDPQTQGGDIGWTILLTEFGLPKSLADVPKFMRHAIAHLNIKPESADGQNLTHFFWILSMLI